MKENTVTLEDWDWCIDDESRLVPWFHILHEVEEKYTVRVDENTRVFRVQDSQKRTYYVKHFSPSGLKEHLIAFFSNKAKILYESAELLHSAGIPCAEYPGWAKNGTESMTLSVAIPNTVTALEYWFRTITHNTALRREFVANLAKMLTAFSSASIIQHDLSMEHILVRNNGSALYIINPCKVEKTEGTLSREEQLELLKPFTELRGEISPETLSIALLENGFAKDSQDASELVHEAIDSVEEEIEENDWPEISNKLLTEDSWALSRILYDGDNVIHVRNTIWHTEIPLPDDSNSLPEEVSAEEAERIWLDSFKAQLLRHLCPRVPLAWERRADGRNVIRYAATYDGILACGFNQ